MMTDCRPRRTLMLLLSLLLLLTRWTTSGFVLKSPATTTYHQSKRRQSAVCTSVTSIAPAPSARCLVLFQSSIIHDYSELEALTPQQIKSLRLETSKRRASKQLETFFLPRDESKGSFSQETLSNLSNQLRAQELVQVRGVAIHNKRQVTRVIERLAVELEWLHADERNGSEKENNNDDNKSSPAVYLVDLQGHCAVLYRPNGTIPLRTTLKGNDWEKRQRPPRDISGQIINPQ